MHRIVIADDHPLVLQGIRHILEETDDMKVVGEASSGTEALSLIARTDPHLVLMDIRMPGLDGLACLDRIRKKHPSIKVIMLSASTDEEQIAAAFKRGATAYIVKSIDPNDLPSAIRQARRQTVYQPVGELLEQNGNGAAPDLTERELTILGAVARGLSNQAISKELWVTEQTVKFHLTNIYRKLGVTSRTEAARYAHQQGLVESTV
jgi:DNA-binding NarL/FixJ family response regulator